MEEPQPHDSQIWIIVYRALRLSIDYRHM